MGADTLVWATLAGQPFRFLVDGQMKLALGDTLQIGVDTSRASLFAKATEDRL